MKVTVRVFGDLVPVLGKNHTFDLEDNDTVNVLAARIAKKATAERAALEAVRDSLERTSCTVAAAASPEGHLYGSVGPAEMAEAFGEDGMEVDPRTVRLEHPLKETGVFVVDIELAPDLIAKTRVWIIAKPH